MAINLTIQIKDLIGDYCDIQFLSLEEASDSGEMVDKESTGVIELLTGFEFESGVARSVVVKAIENASLSGLSLKRTPRGQGEIRVTPAIFSNSLFNN